MSHDLFSLMRMLSSPSEQVTKLQMVGLCTHELWPGNKTSGRLKCSGSLLAVCVAHCPTNQHTIMWLLEEISIYYLCATGQPTHVLTCIINITP